MGMFSLMSCRWRTTPVVRRMDAQGNHNLQSIISKPVSLRARYHALNALD